MRSWLSGLNGAAIFCLAAAIETSICIWVFLILPLIPLAYPASLQIIQFISSGVLQLVALPVLAVASKRSGEQTMKLIRETHDAVMDMHEKHAKDLTLLHKKHDDLHAKTDKMRATIKPKRTTK